MLRRLLLQQHAGPGLSRAFAEQFGTTDSFILPAMAAASAAAVLPDITAIWACAQLRRYAAASGASEGPRESKLRAVPFFVTPYEAKQTFDDYYAKNPLHRRPSGGLQKVKEAFLPFWVSCASVRSALRSAEIGHQVWMTVYNPASRRMEQQLRMSYQQVPFNVVFERQYSAEEEGSQVYASWKYPRSSIRAMRPAERITAAKPFTSDMVEAFSSEQDTRRVGPFEMRPAIAAGLSLDWYKKQEWQAARKWLMANVECDDVRQIDLETTVLEQQLSPVYVPLYIFRSYHLGEKIHTFVSGCIPGKVAGVLLLDEVRVGIVAGAAALVGILVTEAWKWQAASTLMWTWVAPAAALGAFAARYLPRVWLQFSRANQERQRAKTSQQQGPWDAEYVSAFDPDSQRQHQEHVYSGAYDRTSQQSSDFFEKFLRGIFGGPQQQQQQQQRQQQRQQYPGAQQPRAPPSGDPRDPAGHYQRLRLTPNASKDEIQAAFRGLAKRFHPDHVDDPEKKQVASQKFREILESYTVLRDPAKRQQYDRGVL